MERVGLDSPVNVILHLIGECQTHVSVIQSDSQPRVGNPVSSSQLGIASILQHGVGAIGIRDGLLNTLNVRVHDQK